MAKLSLRDAAGQAGVGKSTILRAVQSGRLSADRTDGGGYAIDPAELFRVYPPKGTGTAARNGVDRVAHQSAGQDAPPDEPPATPDATAIRIHNARLEAEIDSLKAILAAEQRRADELRQDRDRWHAQAEASIRMLTDQRPARSWWRRLVG